MANGGKRPGAGRKKGSISKKTKEKRIIEAEARAHLVASFLKQWSKAEQTILNTALGKIKVVEYKGKLMHVYERPPSEKMLQLIIETIIGKPTQPVNGTVNMPELQQLASDIRSILTPKQKP